MTSTRRTAARALTWWAVALLGVPAIGTSTAVGHWAGGPLTSLAGFIVATATVCTLGLWSLQRPRDDR